MGYTVILLEIMVLFVLPAILLYLDIIPFKYRVQTFIVIILGVFSLIVGRGMTPTELGIRTDNLLSSLHIYAALTLIGVILIIAFAKTTKQPPMSGWKRNKHFLIWFAPLSILQELAFRGYLIPRLQEVSNSGIIIILLNAALFTLIHFIYANDWNTLMILFAGGILFATVYVQYPNLILIAIAHIILNFAAQRFNLYRLEKHKHFHFLHH
ncbi:CPBP family intramembrane metalloprotease [Candidatus Woesearchaeota archaeon]|nr:CPBP family intramembrane metalloprotease [Candidatus Woesearchaeota archaeon]